MIQESEATQIEATQLNPEEQPTIPMPTQTIELSDNDEPMPERQDIPEPFLNDPSRSNVPSAHEGIARLDSQSTMVWGEDSLSQLSRSLSWTREEMIVDMLFQEFPEESFAIGDKELHDFVRNFFMATDPDPEFIASHCENTDEIRVLAKQATESIKDAHGAVKASNKLFEETTNAAKIMRDKLSLVMGGWIESVKQGMLTQDEFNKKQKAGEQWLEENVDAAWHKNSLLYQEAQAARQKAADAVMAVWHCAKPLDLKPAVVEDTTSMREVHEALDEALTEELAKWGLEKMNPYAASAVAKAPICFYVYLNLR